MNNSMNWPSQGCGVGLRSKHYPFILSEWPKIDWLEAVTENFLDTGGRPLKVLQEIRQHYPVALHGVSLSIGSCDPLDIEYLKKVKELVRQIDPFVVSDHLCWTGVEGENLHDLLPLPFTTDAMKHVTRRISQVQEILGRAILIENISTYVTYKHSQVSEWDFLREVARRSGCGILLDLNNIFVNATNHCLDPVRYLEAIPPSFVGQFHLAGHTDKGAYLFDTHSSPVVPSVWQLYEKALRLYGPVSTLVEWDEDIPDFSRLVEEVEMARRIYDKLYKEKPKEVPPVPLYFPENNFIPRPSLLNAQRDFKARVRAAREGSRVADWLNPQGGSSGEERMAVYSEGYVARLSEALSEAYETVRHLLGKEAFTELCELYLDRFPSRDYNLNQIGKEFPNFIGYTRFATELPFLPDLAALELAVVSAFHAFDQAPFDSTVLATLSEEDWEKMQVIFQPSVHVVGSQWPIVNIWKARKTPLPEMNIPLIECPQNALIYRKNLEVYCEVIEKNQMELVQNLLKGNPLGQTCLSVAESASSEELPLEEWFSSWTGQGLITRVV